MPRPLSTPGRRQPHPSGDIRPCFPPPPLSDLLPLSNPTPPPPPPNSLVPLHVLKHHLQALHRRQLQPLWPQHGDKSRWGVRGGNSDADGSGSGGGGSGDMAAAWGVGGSRPTPPDGGVCVVGHGGGPVTATSVDGQGKREDDRQSGGRRTVAEGAAGGGRERPVGVEKEERGGNKQTAVWVCRGGWWCPCVRERCEKRPTTQEEPRPTVYVLVTNLNTGHQPLSKKIFSKKENKHWFLL